MNKKNLSYNELITRCNMQILEYIVQNEQLNKEVATIKKENERMLKRIIKLETGLAYYARPTAYERGEYWDIVNDAGKIARKYMKKDD